MKNYRSLYSTDGLFAEQILFFLLSLNIAPHLNGFHRKDVSASLATTQDEYLTVFMHEIPELDKEIKYRILRKLICLSAQTLLVDCYEKIKSMKLIDDSHIIEFFRHLRNAAAHNGRFVIQPGSIKRIARWRDKEISYNLNGKDLFGNFFAIGDSILFLQDIERHVRGNKTPLSYVEEPPILRKHPSGILWPKDPRHWLYKIESLALGLKKLLRKKSKSRPSSA